MIGVFLDTETNGLNPKVHRIFEIAYKVVDLSTGAFKDEYETLIAHPADVWEKSDPSSLQINGFTWEEVSKGLSPPTVAQAVIDSFEALGVKRKKAVFICQNPSFDRNFLSHLIDPDTQETLNWPYHWLDLASMHWALSIDRAKRQRGPLPWEIGFSKDLIASHYRLPPEKKPHRAMNGVEHLLLCYQAAVGFPEKE